MSHSDFPQDDDLTDDEIAAEIAASADGEEASDAGSEAAALKDQLLRMAAELENTRRRAEREKADAGRYAIANFARDLLSVTDNFERALDAFPADAAAQTPDALTGLMTGLRMTDKELHAVLERHGVKKIDPQGEKFDPNLHQAVAQAPSDAPSGHVANVAQTGFMIGDRVLRAAMVVVSTGGGAGDAPKPDSASNDAADQYGAASDVDGPSNLDKKV